MKRLKLLIWILVLFIIEIVFINRLDFFSSAPDVVFAFCIAYAVIEEDYDYAVGIGIICGICTGSICGGSFAASVLMYSYSVLIIKELLNRLRYIPYFAKMLFFAFALSAIGKAVIYFVLNLSFELRILWEVILPYAICNLIAAAVLYPLVKKTMVVIDEKRKLIPD